MLAHDAVVDEIVNSETWWCGRKSRTPVIESQGFRIDVVDKSIPLFVFGSHVQQFLSFVHFLTSPTMYRPASRFLLQHSLPPLRSVARRRFLSTAPPHEKSRSWKNSAARWGLGIAGVYYYNTSTVFAEEPARTCDSRK